MWICFNNAFVSIVQDKTDPAKLVVRARARAHLVALFGRRAPIVETPRADYRWRLLTSRAKIARLLVNKVETLSYVNFKDSVKDDRLHDMYLTWWSDHHQFQNDPERKKYRHALAHASTAWFAPVAGEDEKPQD
jgi:hypothetical protein